MADTLRQHLEVGVLKKAKRDSRRLSLFDAAYRCNAGRQFRMKVLRRDSPINCAMEARVECDLETLYSRVKVLQNCLSPLEIGMVTRN